jgi:hypothetical protein
VRFYIFFGKAVGLGERQSIYITWVSKTKAGFRKLCWFYHYIMQAEIRSLSAGDPRASLLLERLLESLTSIYFVLACLKFNSNQRILGILSRVPISLHGLA